ncbi:DUF6124 family protein [Pseudomonas sp. T1.Ur]|uniref:DUF6124 family protein n=1 Tax=Pseudomonas sp. T1.Ur TaxID=2928704 RepID=UPI00201E30D5|nr:DUF6124 family protein [Pseudomonas sp. T1.Ur]MCL6700435.1 DUF6124 family protein [Pseudomonas sp. T1.Ur]
MTKPTPNPPKKEHTSRTQSANAKKLDDAATRALDYYLKPKTDKETCDTPDTLFIIAPPNIDAECLLANLSETLASANAMVSDLAFDLKGSRRNIALGVQQMIELSQLLANRALDVVEVR